MKFRIFFIIGGTTLVFLFSIFNLYQLQIKKSDYYAQQARAQNAREDFMAAQRGIIYITDKNNSTIPAAILKDYPVIYAVPKEIIDPGEASQLVSQAFNLEAAKLLALFSKPDSLYEKLIPRATTEQVAKVRELNIDGLYIGEAKGRFYPFGDLAAHVLGFVAPTKESDAPRGRYGIEAYQDEQLAGVPGHYAEDRFVAPVAGQNIVTTIDRNVQARSQEILNQLVEKYQPVAGTIIVQEPETGKIVALADYPTFDPNEYGKFEVGVFLNPAVSSVYEPGSIFKVITMAAGIDSGKITPDTTYYDTGSLTLNTKTIRNWDHKAHGTLTMTNVIEQSVNTGAAFAQRQTGRDIFYDYLVKFGFKEPTGIGLPNEVVGKLTPLEKNKQDINFATASFGQGVSVTPIRLISAISTIANHGILKRPYITEANRSDEERRVISAESARQVTAMMVSAVSKAQVAAVPNYDVAGKTGTAQIPDFKKGGYLDFDEGVIHSYAGFAPAYDPKFTILIKLDKPKDGHKAAPLAGRTVVPAFRELTEFLLNYYNVPPKAGVGQ